MPTIRPTTGYIYALACPHTGTIRYVGQSTQPLLRFIAHVRTAAEIAIGKPTVSLALYQWINSLLVKSEQPRMIILDECPKADLTERELYYIRKYQHLKLFNISIPSRPQLKHIDRNHLLKLAHQKQISLHVLAKSVGVGGPDLLRFLQNQPTKQFISLKAALAIEKYILNK